ncbi:MAG TPA: PQQ-binding-like beta-propeller repeat protein [Chthoniobacteraceae bacterium]|nr:PQQ-binding-like beta-propeller repeat protein [Chthoniobacteraceae bacterium]
MSLIRFWRERSGPTAAFAFAIARALALIGSFGGAHAADQPQWGVGWSRNMVSRERALPDSFDVNSGRHIKWSAKLGSESHSSPVIAGGHVFIGTNNDEPRDARHQGDRGVLMCLDERTGELVWQLVVPKRSDDQYFDWPKSGISSPATVEGERVYIVDNRGAVLCLDVRGMANGNDGPFTDEPAYFTPHPAPPPTFKTRLGTIEPARAVERDLKGDGDAHGAFSATDADIIWMLDMPSQAGIWPHDAAHSSILIDGDLLYLNTGTGVDNSHRAIRTPDAPSLLVLDKRTGALVARDQEKIAPQIFHATWSSPSRAVINGTARIFFAAGDGILRGFAPVIESGGKIAGPRTLKRVWQFDPDPNAPKENVHRFTSNRQIGPSNIYGMPVALDGKIYVAGGGDLFWGKNEAWLKCIDATGMGDVTSTGEIWSYPLNRHVVSTPAITEDGLVFIADVGRTVHCVERASGKPLWTHATQGEFWASPYVADGKVFIGNRKGEFFVFRASREKELLSSFQFKQPISATACAANGVLYIGTMTHLYAVAL